MLNLSPLVQTISIRSISLWGNPTDVFANKTVPLKGDKWTLEPWGYRVYEYLEVVGATPMR
jgi:hypothetical protein